MADIWLMSTTMFTRNIGTKMNQASQAPMSRRIISINPCPPAIMPTRDAESRVKMTIGTTYSAIHSRSNPNQAPASRRVATAPAPIMPAAVNAAGPTSFASVLSKGMRMGPSTTPPRERQTQAPR